jgi:3-phosphoshikimate 1-carboxyvinyltransferase
VVAPGLHYEARRYQVEPDATAASYFFAAAAVTGGTVRVTGIGAGSAQGDLAFIEVLARMGCSVVKRQDWVEVTGPDRLAGVDADMGGISDTALTLAAIAPLASGPVRITGIAHTRAQESDRVAAAVTELRRVGAEVSELADGLVIEPSQSHLRGASIRTYGDHRVAMAFAVLGLVLPGIAIEDPGCVAKTFPDFFERFEALLASR